MTVQSHELHEEFPEFRDKIHQLKTEDGHFRRLFDEYHTIGKEIKRIEQEIETVSDVYAETLKKKRLHLKDELFSMLKKAA